MKRTTSLVSSMAVVALLALAQVASSADPPATELGPKAETQLYIRTLPPGAKIVLDGKSQGISPRLLVVPPGVDRMTIEVELDGHAKQARVVEIRGGRITRVEFELNKAAPTPPVPNETAPAADAAPRSRLGFLAVLHPSLSVGAEDLPEGWKIHQSFFAPSDQTAAIEKKVGGRIKKLSNTILTAHGQQVRVNVLECATRLDADKVHKAVLAMKGDPAYCLRFGNTVVEFVGEFDVAFAKRAARELGLTPAPEHPEPPSVGPADASATEGPQPASPHRRPRYFVRLVVGQESITFEGKETTWEQLPRLLEKVPNRKQTVLEFATPSDQTDVQQRKLDRDQATLLARRSGFEYRSDIGVHPLGSKGSPAQIAASPHRRPRYFVRLVVGQQSITFEGKETTWEELPGLLEKVPNRKQTVLEFAVTSGQITGQRYHPDMVRAVRLADRFGFEYLSDIGVHPRGSKGSPAQLGPDEAAQTAPGRTTTN